MSNKSLDQQNYDDRDRWTRLNKTWYTSGRAYRELDQIDGTINSSFQRWMDHPDYDAYWQSMIPYHQDFAKINIPVLTTTGYYDGGQIGALYYFNEHYKYNAQANHYLVIGPYNHIGAQRSAWDVLMGYRIDPIAHIDISWDLRYAWFDHVLRGAPMPALLTDKVNYEVMGANQWKHAKSISAMSNAKMRLYLTAMKSGDAYHLGAKAQKDKSFITQNIDFSDRSNVDESGGGGIIDTTVDKRNALVFVSDPLTQVTEVSGFFSGLLDFTTNKKDFDFNITLYEQQPDGKFFQLSWYMMRASYVNDLSHRRLLQPDLRHKLKFTNGRTTSKRFEAGSRVVAVLSINKQPTVQINYGSGKNVNDETIQDAGSPLQIKWFPDSYLDIPIEQ
jgi:putative CocE/NonD family hydrolase